MLSGLKKKDSLRMLDNPEERDPVEFKPLSLSGFKDVSTRAGIACDVN